MSAFQIVMGGKSDDSNEQVVGLDEVDDAPLIIQS
jgi:hypothetical protein